MVRGSAIVLAITCIVVACDSPTAPRIDFDQGLLPYAVSPRGVRVHGTSRLVVILARFADGAPVPLTATQINAQLFAAPNGGAVNESFFLASGGTFTLGGEVTQWLTTSVSVSEAQTSGLSALDTYARQAVELADPNVDFSHYDNDGPDGRPNSGDDDGIVDGGVAIFNSEHNAYCDAGTGRGPHPFARSHWRWNGDFVPTHDSSANGGLIRINGYSPMSATACGGASVGVHVLAHELGHLWFGLPDIYHVVDNVGEAWQRRRWIMGCWDLMAAGGWGCGSGAPNLDYRFNTFGAWSRVEIGWVQPYYVDVSRDSTYDLLALTKGGTVLKIPIRDDAEYLLVEYREPATGDRRLPGDGVLIYHIAADQSAKPNSPTGSYSRSLIEADDDSALFRTDAQGGDRGTAGDAFGINRYSFKTGEHSRAHAMDGSPLPFQITDILIFPSQHRARLRISPPSGS